MAYCKLIRLMATKISRLLTSWKVFSKKYLDRHPLLVLIMEVLEYLARHVTREGKWGGYPCPKKLCHNNQRLKVPTVYHKINL